jgi:hypothetical protein
MRHHLVVLHRRYLDLLLDGRKRVECRFSKIKRPPYEAVAPGDLLWLKLPSGPVEAVARAAECRFQTLRSGEDVRRIQRAHGDAISAPDEFYVEAASWARYCTLIWIETVLAIRPMTVYKPDQRAWAVLGRAPRPGMRVAWAS